MVIPGSGQSMHGYILTCSRLQRENINLLALGSQQMGTLISASTVPHCRKEGRVKLWIGMTTSSVARPKGKDTVSSVARPEGKRPSAQWLDLKGKRPSAQWLDLKYHWRELAQVSSSFFLFLSRQTGVCCDKSFVATNVFVATSLLLSLQKFCHGKIVCCGKYLSQQKVCCNKNIFVATKVLLQQAYFCHDKRCVLSRQTCVCHDKHVFVMTKLLL